MTQYRRDPYYKENEQVYYKGKVHIVLDWTICAYLRCPYTETDVFVGHFKHRPVYAIDNHRDENGVVIPVAQRELRKVYATTGNTSSNIFGIESS